MFFKYIYSHLAINGLLEEIVLIRMKVLIQYVQLATSPPLLEFASLNGGLSPPFFYKPTFIDSIFILVALSIF